MSTRTPSRTLLTLATATAIAALAACQPSTPSTGEGASAAAPDAADSGIANDAAMNDSAAPGQVAGDMAAQDTPLSAADADGNPVGDASGGTLADASPQAGGTAADATAAAAHRDHDMPKGPVDDKTFHMHAQMGNVAEIAASQAALSKTQHAGIRQFAQQLQADHTANMKQVATASGQQPPSQPDAKHQAMLAKVSAQQGEAFDRAWLQMMEADHVKTIALFENAAKSEQTSAQSKKLAQATLPKLRDHLQTARRLLKEVGGTGGAASGTTPAGSGG